MKITYLGEVVRQQRKLLDIPQELVCEGLCTAMTLSRFESGRQTPSHDCVVAILQRLGLPDDRYYAQLTRTETRLTRLRKEARAYYTQFEHTLGEERRQARADALETLCRLERCIKKDDRINQQFILEMRATLEGHPPQKQLEMLMQAIYLTSPRFDLDDLSKCLYCTEEIAIVNKIVITLSCCGQRPRAINIFNPLLKLVQKRISGHSLLTLIAYNFALQLGLDGHLEEALEISELGRQVCIKQGYYYALPRFLHLEGECYYQMGENSKSL